MGLARLQLEASQLIGLLLALRMAWLVPVDSVLTAGLAVGGGGVAIAGVNAEQRRKNCTVLTLEVRQ